MLTTLYKLYRLYWNVHGPLPRALAEVNRQWYSRDPLFHNNFTFSHSPSTNHHPLYNDHDRHGHEHPHDNHQGVARQHVSKAVKAILVIVSINMVIMMMITMITMIFISMIIIRVARQRVPKVAKGPNVLTSRPLLLPAPSSPWSSYHHHLKMLRLHKQLLIILPAFRILLTLLNRFVHSSCHVRVSQVDLCWKHLFQ